MGTYDDTSYTFTISSVPRGQCHLHAVATWRMVFRCQRGCTWTHMAFTQDTAAVAAAGDIQFPPTPCNVVYFNVLTLSSFEKRRTLNTIHFNSCSHWAHSMHGAIAVPSVTRCRCCRRCRRGHRCAGDVPVAACDSSDTWWMAMWRRLAVANGPNIFQMLLVSKVVSVNLTGHAQRFVNRRGQFAFVSLVYTVAVAQLETCVPIGGCGHFRFTCRQFSFCPSIGRLRQTPKISDSSNTAFWWPVWWAKALSDMTARRPPLIFGK